MCKHLATLSALTEHSPGFYPHGPPQMQPDLEKQLSFSLAHLSSSLWTLLLRMSFTTLVLFCLESPGGPMSQFVGKIYI